MPALVACGRMWEFASDDMFCPGIAAVSLHTVWLFGMLGGVLYFREALSCESSHYLVGFASILLFITVCGILVELTMTILSGRGSIVRMKPRRPIVPLLYVRMGITVAEVILLVIGSAFVIIPDLVNVSKCGSLDKALLMMRVVVGAYWFSFLTMIGLAALYLDPCHCYSAKVNYAEVTRQIEQGNINEEVIETHWKLVHTAWEKRFKVLCCLAGSDDVHHLAYREVAEMFAHLFCDTDVVVSDIVAGFILLQKEEIAQEKAIRDGVIPMPPPDEPETNSGEILFSFDFHVQEDRELFRDAVHFMKYAVGMYTWPFYIYMNPLCGLCRLYSNLSCCSQQRGDHIHKDNRCSCHMVGLTQFTGLNEADVVYASFENDVYKVPFMVCYDHDSASVVLVFRGTLSLGDVVTDLTASAKPIELPNFPNFLVHKGMLKTVTAVLEKLEEDRILESAFEQAPGYKLVIAGHSLGSGCACLSAILLREKYPTLRCFCYSSPGAMMNEAAAIYTEEFVTSITLGKDFVARLNVPNTHQLKEDLVRVLEECRKPKCRILAEGCLETMATCFGASIVFSDKTYSTPQISSSASYGHSSPAHMTSSPTHATSSPCHSIVNPNSDVIVEIEDPQEAEAGPIEEVDSVESDPLLTNIDLEKSLRGLRHAIPFPSATKSTKRTHSEITPIFRPSLSSLKLPVRGTGRTSPSTSGSITKEVQRRLVPLFIPGKIIHLVDVSETKRCFCASRQLEVKWGSRHKFNKFNISPDMIRDHFPDVLTKAMNAVWSRKMADMEDSEIRRRHVPHDLSL